MHSVRTATGPSLLRRLDSFICAIAIACLVLCGSSRPALASQATVTTLSLTSGGRTVSSVAGGAVVTLTASVKMGATAITLGQVNFCDAAAASCTDIHLVGTAQLTSAGTAVLHFRPGAGSHSYKAVFLGNLDASASASTSIGLTVGPRMPGLETTFTLASISGPVATDTYGTYALTANVGTKGAVQPSGTVSFSGTDAATGNPFSLSGTATLGVLSGGTGFLNVPIPVANNDLADAPPVVVIGDFNNDGIPDIVSAPHGGIAVSLGKGDGTFAASLIPNVDSVDGINAFGVGDFNGDGIADLLVADEDTGQLTVLLGKGDGTFTVGQSMHDPAVSLAVADFNGDGNLDVALSGPSEVSVLLGNGDGTFTAAPNPPSISSFQVVAADFNGDGKIDLAVVSSTDNSVTILLGNGDGTFTRATTQPRAVASQIVVADFDGDGKIDLATLDPTADTISILQGNCDGTFTDATSLPLDLSFGAYALAVGDFNGDGKPDIAVAVRANNPSTTPSAKVSVLPGNGDGTFAGRFDVPLVAGELTSLAAADLTGNGSWDLATFGSVFLGNLSITTATADNVLPTGDDVIEADYPGDTSNAPSRSTNEPAIFVPQQSFSLSSNPVTVSAGASASGDYSVKSVTFAGTLNLSCSISALGSATNAPTCSVQPTIVFFSPGGTESLVYTVTTQTTTPAGQYSITIMAADATGAVLPASTSAAITVPAPPGFALSGTAINIAAPGPSATSTVTITPSGGFTGTVALSCAVTGGPAGGADAPTCSVSSPPSITGGAAVDATLTVSTTAASPVTAGNFTTPNQHLFHDIATTGPVVALTLLLCFGFPVQRRRRTIPLLGLLLIVTLTGATIGCGATKTAPPPPANPGTTPGVYTVTITGMSGSITATAVVKVTVN